MKLPRCAASAVGAAIVAVSALALAGPASAATPGVTYLTAADVTFGGPSDGGWGQYNGAVLTNSVNGLEVQGFTELWHNLPADAPATTGSALVDFAAGSDFTASSPDGIYPVILLNGGTLSPVLLQGPSGTDSLTEPTSLWTVHSDLGTIGFGSLRTLAQIDAELSTNPALAGWTITDFGLGLDTLTVRTATVNGTEFSFMPTPTPTAPSTVSLDVYLSSGVTISTTGFVPGEELEVYYSYPTADGVGGGGPVQPVTADTNGAVTYTFVPAAAPAPIVGTYKIVIVGSTGPQFFQFEVTAAVAGPALAATGTDSFGSLAAGGVLLLGGALLAVVAMRKRRAL